MFATTKVKLAAGLATGALTLGAAGAYAAANNTITVANPTPITVPGINSSSPLSVISVSGKTTAVKLPAKFDNRGQCVSFFAQNKDLALAPTTATSGALKLSKTFHGKLMGTVAAWCEKQVTKSTTAADSTDKQTVETPDATETTTTDATDSAQAQPGKSHGHGHGHGHGRGSANS
ncbi:MAG: hypothetical protein M3077_01265 [Candidatus Dormibacteraeota bacterium]|nr:hypothetical protein [Candidatus Dormibacteraeota bacterium]